MNDILIRKVKYEDIEQIVDICIHDWQVEYKGIVDDKILENLNKKEKMEKWKIRYKMGYTIVAEQKGKILGYCRYDDKIDDKNIEADSEIIELYVDNKNLSKGIGKKLVEYAIKDLKAKNRNKMIIYCLKENLKARRFYEKMGGKLIENKKYFEKEGKKYEEVGYIYNLKNNKPAC